MEQDAAPADGRNAPPESPGGAGAPPAGTTDPLPGAGSRRTAPVGGPSKARPGVEQMPHWSAARRAPERVLTPQGVYRRPKRYAALRSPSLYAGVDSPEPPVARGRKGKDGQPGPG